MPMRWRLPRRATHSRRKKMMVLAAALAVVAVALLLLLLLATVARGRIPWPGQAARQDASVLARLAGVQATPSAAQQDCAAWRDQRPLVLLVLGQSNAGNHGAPSPGGSPAVRVMNAGVCAFSADPLPGATGQGGSVWSLLPAALAAGGLGRPVLLQLLAVDGTTVDDWVRHSSPLRQRLLDTLAANGAVGLKPDLVLWQQGEADASAGTPADRYIRGLQELAAALDRSAVKAPILAARSTVCGSTPHLDLGTAVDALPHQHPRFTHAPNTDAITARRDGCHFDLAGRQQAARSWATAIKAALDTP